VRISFAGVRHRGVLGKVDRKLPFHSQILSFDRFSKAKGLEPKSQKLESGGVAMLPSDQKESEGGSKLSATELQISGDSLLGKTLNFAARPDGLLTF
jgi:hypothetical protein